MSSAFERFIAGKDRLSALLRELPAYPPPAGAQSRFAAAASKAQAEYAAPPAFEPPPSLEKTFQETAAKVDLAQQARREAALQEIASGKPIEKVLGGTIAPAGKDWLKQQAQPTPKPPPRHWFRLGWRDIQVIGLAAILAAWGTHHYLQRRPSNTETVMLDAFRQAADASHDDEQDESAAIAAKLEESIRANLRQRSTTKPESAESVATTSGHTPARKTPDNPGDKVTRLATPQPTAKLPAQRKTSIPAAGPAVTSSIHEDRMPATAESGNAPAALQAQPVQASQGGSGAAASPITEEAPHRARETLAAAPAPMAMAKAALQSPPPIHASLSDDPAIIAAQLPAAASGYSISCADPEDSPMTNWIAGLRHALQEKGRFHLTVRKNPALEKHVLVITAGPAQ